MIGAMNTDNVQRTSPAVEKLRASLAALPRRDLAKVARFAGLNLRGIQYFADGDTVLPGVLTLNAMLSGFARFEQYAKDRQRVVEKYTALPADDIDSDLSPL